MKVAVVDLQRAVMQTEDGLRAQATLKKLFDNRQLELNKRQTELQKQKDDIDKQSKSPFADRGAEKAGGLAEADGRAADDLRRICQ